MKASQIAIAGLFLGMVGSLLVSCSQSVSPVPRVGVPAYSSADGGATITGAPGETRAMAPAPLKKRSGIATGWGRTMKSSLTYGRFERSASNPVAVSLIRYNDAAGARAMGVKRVTAGKGMQEAAAGLVAWGMTTGTGPLSSYRWRGDRFVIGKKGREYRLEVQNLSDVRLEVVLSVDGLDVIDGRPASTKKRGYLIAAGKKLVVRGFRTSPKQVATFEFSSVDQSYAAQRHGETRNVGVVGLAVFTEKGREPGKEAQTRRKARAFAEAPPVRGR